eukprot:1966059-Alexandrium_andersonii.AAC.1
MGLSRCCVDSGFSAKIQQAVGAPSDLLADGLQDFMASMFRQSVFSTAAIECLFASYRQWTTRSGKPVSMETLGAKHEAHLFH